MKCAKCKDSGVINYTTPTGIVGATSYCECEIGKEQKVTELIRKEAKQLAAYTGIGVNEAESRIKSVLDWYPDFVVREKCRETRLLYKAAKEIQKAIIDDAPIPKYPKGCVMNEHNNFVWESLRTKPTPPEGRTSNYEKPTTNAKLRKLIKELEKYKLTMLNDNVKLLAENGHLKQENEELKDKLLECHKIIVNKSYYGI